VIDPLIIPDLEAEESPYWFSVITNASNMLVYQPRYRFRPKQSLSIQPILPKQVSHPILQGTSQPGSDWNAETFFGAIHDP
jgi:hypothetical protein